MNSGIYQISGPNGKFYVGSTENFKSRLGNHKSSLRGNYHACPPLQRAWNKYGEEAFSFEPLMCFEPSELVDIEQETINALWDTGILYNVVKEVKSPMRGRHHSPEARAAISRSRVGKIHSAEARERMSQACKGKNLGNKFNFGTKYSAESRAKMSAAQLGRKHTPETIAKMKAAQLKNWATGKRSTERQGN